MPRAMRLDTNDAATKNLLCLTRSSEKVNSRWGPKCGYGVFRVTPGGNRGVLSSL